MNTFVRIHIFKEDYRMLGNMFGNNESRPAQGVLVHRALNHIQDLERELEAINKVIQEGKK